jgi:hypothetical protein
MFKNLLFIAIGCLLFTPSVQAANLEIHPSLLDAGGFKVEVFLNSKGDILNATEGKLSVPTNWRVREVRSADSVVSFWVEKPHLENGIIIWSGVMPGGFESVLSPYQTESGSGKLFEIFFSEKPTAEEEIKLKEGRVFLNDGLGTSKDLDFTNLKISGNSLIGSPIKTEIRDILPPEDFLPLISRSPDIFNNQWFVSFAASDKESGIVDYYVYESDERKEIILNKDWEKAVSPHLLRDQSLESFVFVRAVDGAGNERTVVLEPGELSIYPQAWRWIIIILVALGVAVLPFLRAKNKK